MRKQDEILEVKTKTKKSSWEKYAMEFLMVFAAITLGFFAENQREKWGENTRGVQYAQRLVKDLDLDSIRMEEVKASYTSRKQQINTLIILMHGGLDNEPFLDSLFTYFTLPGSGSLVTGINFVENLATRDELKSGNMRLIRSDSIVRQLSLYTRREQIFLAIKPVTEKSGLNYWSLWKRYMICLDWALSDWRGKNQYLMCYH